MTWAANEPPPVEVRGPGIFDVTIFRQSHSTTVHLVNLTNPMMMKGPLRETMPVGPLQVQILLPDGRRPSRVSLLTEGRNVAVSMQAGAVQVDIPAVSLHEVIALDD